MSELIQTDLIEEDRLHVHLNGRYSINIKLTHEGVIVDVWEGGFEGDECLSTMAIADSDWKNDLD